MGVPYIKCSLALIEICIRRTFSSRPRSLTSDHPKGARILPLFFTTEANPSAGASFFQWASIVPASPAKPMKRRNEK